MDKRFFALALVLVLLAPVFNACDSPQPGPGSGAPPTQTKSYVDIAAEVSRTGTCPTVDLNDEQTYALKEVMYYLYRYGDYAARISTTDETAAEKFNLVTSAYDNLMIKLGVTLANRYDDAKLTGLSCHLPVLGHLQRQDYMFSQEGSYFVTNHRESFNYINQAEAKRAEIAGFLSQRGIDISAGQSAEGLSPDDSIILSKMLSDLMMQSSAARVYQHAAFHLHSPEVAFEPLSIEDGKPSSIVRKPQEYVDAIETYWKSVAMGYEIERQYGMVTNPAYQFSYASGNPAVNDAVEKMIIAADIYKDANMRRLEGRSLWALLSGKQLRFDGPWHTDIFTGLNYFLNTFNLFFWMDDLSGSSEGWTEYYYQAQVRSALKLKHLSDANPSLGIAGLEQQLVNEVNSKVTTRVAELKGLIDSNGDVPLYMHDNMVLYPDRTVIRYYLADDVEREEVISKPFTGRIGLSGGSVNVFNLPQDETLRDIYIGGKGGWITHRDPATNSEVDVQVFGADQGAPGADPVKVFGNSVADYGGHFSGQKGDVNQLTSMYLDENNNQYAGIIYLAHLKSDPLYNMFKEIEAQGNNPSANQQSLFRTALVLRHNGDSNIAESILAGLPVELTLQDASKLPAGMTYDGRTVGKILEDIRGTKSLLYLDSDEFVNYGIAETVASLANPAYYLGMAKLSEGVAKGVTFVSGRSSAVATVLRASNRIVSAPTLLLRSRLMGSTVGKLFAYSMVGTIYGSGQIAEEYVEEYAGSFHPALEWAVVMLLVPDPIDLNVQPHILDATNQLRFAEIAPGKVMKIGDTTINKVFFVQDFSKLSVFQGQPGVVFDPTLNGYIYKDVALLPVGADINPYVVAEVKLESDTNVDAGSVQIQDIGGPRYGFTGEVANRYNSLVHRMAPQGRPLDMFRKPSDIESNTLATGEMLKQTGMPPEFFEGGQEALDAYTRYDSAIQHANSLLQQGKRELSLGDLTQLDGMLEGQAVNVRTTDDVFVTLEEGEWQFPPASSIDGYVTEMNAWGSDALNAGVPKERVGEGMRELVVRLHPFYNANGRLGMVVEYFYAHLP